MLATAALFLAATVQHPVLPSETQLNARLVKLALKLGWTRKTTPAMIKSHADFVDEQFSKGAYDLLIRVEEFGNTMEAATGLQGRRVTAAALATYEEPALAGTGLRLDVPDYSHIRIRDFKEYGGTKGMLITGAFKNFVETVDLPARKPQGGNPAPAAAYDDVLKIAKSLANELKGYKPYRK